MPQTRTHQPPASASTVLAEILATAARNLKYNVKRKGEFAESFFQLRALALGFLVSKLWGDSAPADFHVEWPGRLSRIQVKSAWSPARADSYWINTVIRSGRKGCRAYSPAEIDFYACIVMPLGLVYIIPSRAVKPGQKCLFLYPIRPRRHQSGPRMPSYEKFRERWDLLQ